MISHGTETNLLDAGASFKPDFTADLLYILGYSLPEIKLHCVVGSKYSEYTNIMSRGRRPVQFNS